MQAEFGDHCLGSRVYLIVGLLAVLIVGQEGLFYIKHCICSIPFNISHCFVLCKLILSNVFVLYYLMSIADLIPPHCVSCTSLGVLYYMTI
jgi:hypothetical protein